MSHATHVNESRYTYEPVDLCNHMCVEACCSVLHVATHIWVTKHIRTSWSLRTDFSWASASFIRALSLLCVAVCCSVLQCVAVCCSVLQCVAVCLQWVAVCCSVLAVRCSALQCVAVHCGVSASFIGALSLLRGAVRYSVLQYNSVCCCCSLLQRVAVCCSVLQCARNVLQCVAVRCSAL